MPLLKALTDERASSVFHESGDEAVGTDERRGGIGGVALTIRRPDLYGLVLRVDIGEEGNANVIHRSFL